MSNIIFQEYYKPKPKQQMAHLCSSLYVLFGGAMGGGKSWYLCAEAIINAMRYSGNRLVLLRETLATLKDTTMVTFLSICPPEILKNGGINMQKMTATFINGSVLLFRGVDIRKDPLLQKLKGSEYGWAGIDEANEVPKKVFDVLKSRMRWICPNGVKPSYQIRLTSNPESCWLKPAFIESPKKNHTFIQSLTTDNYDPKDPYIRKLMSAFGDNEDILRRYFGGSWEDSDAANQLFTAETKKKLTTNTPKGPAYSSLGVDVARYGEDRSVLVRLDGGYIANINIYAKTKTTDVSKRILATAIERKIKGERIGVDTVGLGAGVADECEDAGLKVTELVGGDSGKDLLTETVVKPYNFRAALYIALKLDIEAGDLAFGPSITGELREKILAELSMIRYDFASEMRWRIQKKEDIKKQFGVSPDLADALAYANWMRRQKPKQQTPTIFFGGTINKSRK